MKGFYRLLNYSFSRMFPAAVCLCIGIILFPLLLIQLAVQDYNQHTVHERFETVYAATGSIFVFLAGIVLLSGVFIKTIYENYSGSKSMYTFLTLPVRREAIYLSYLIALLICFLMLYAAQLISVICGYGIYAAKVGSYADGQFLMHNGLFLAFIRSDILRILFPFGGSGLFSTLSMAITLLTGLFYGVLCERSKRYKGFFLIVAAGLLMIYMLSGRMVGYQISTAPSITHLNVVSFIFIGLSCIYIWHSLYLVKKGVIV